MISLILYVAQMGQNDTKIQNQRNFLTRSVTLELRFHRCKTPATPTTMTGVSRAPRQSCHLSPLVNLTSTAYSSSLSSVGSSGPLILPRRSGGSQGWGRQKILTNKKLPPSVFSILDGKADTLEVRPQTTARTGAPRVAGGDMVMWEFSSPMNAFFRPFRVFSPDHLVPEHTRPTPVQAALRSQHPKQRAGCCPALPRSPALSALYWELHFPP